MGAREDREDVETVLGGDVSAFERLVLRWQAPLIFYFHEMDISAAARSLGLPEGTVKSRLSRGRKILERKLPLFLSELKLKEVQ